MSYPNPYAPQDHQATRYNDSETDFNPYVNSQEPHSTYDHGRGVADDQYDGEYRDDDVHPNAYSREHQLQRHQPEYLEGDGATRGVPGADASAQRSFGRKESHLGPAVFAQSSSVRPPKTPSNVRQYRKDFQGNLWTKGSRGRCIARFCCCSIMITLLLVVCIVLSLALWIRPPNIEINEVTPTSTGGSQVQLQEKGITINLAVNISVDNPNYFSVDFKQIKAELFYPIKNTPIGGGVSNNVVFESHTQTNWTFPFAIEYKTASDPNSLILLDLAQKCGLNGPVSNLSVDYKITVGLRILMITVSPVVSNTFTFRCPLDPNDLKKLLSSTGAGGT